MPKLILAEAIRYFFPGLWAVFFLSLVQPSAIEQIQNRFTPLGFLLLILVVSVAFYALYRSFIYDSVILRIQDLLRRGPKNYRLFLRQEYKLDHPQAVQMFLTLREKCLRDQYSGGIQVRAASVHMLYLAGILGVPFALWSFWIHNSGSVIIIGLISVVCLLGAFIEDRRYEEMELGFVKSIPAEVRLKTRIDLFGPMPSANSEQIAEPNGGESSATG